MGSVACTVGAKIRKLSEIFFVGFCRFLIVIFSVFFEVPELVVLVMGFGRYLRGFIWVLELEKQRGCGIGGRRQNLRQVGFNHKHNLR